MITLEEWNLLYELVNWRLNANGYMYFGTADFYSTVDLHTVEKLEELEFIAQVYLEGVNYIEPKLVYDFREYPHILLPLGQIALMWPDTVVEDWR